MFKQPKEETWNLKIDTHNKIEITRVSQKFCYILVHDSLTSYRSLDHSSTCCGRYYHGNWCADVLYIDSLSVWFESHMDEHAMSSNLGTWALWTWTEP